jgi:hypothetical protein
LCADSVTLINVNLLGELPEVEAQRYFCGDGDGGWPGLVAQRQAPPLEAGTWAAVYAVCGGNMGLLNQCVGMAKQAGSSWGTGACRDLPCAAAPACPAPGVPRHAHSQYIPGIPLLQR